jgi:hypothetical protein
MHSFYIQQFLSIENLIKKRQTTWLICIKGYIQNQRACDISYPRIARSFGRKIKCNSFGGFQLFFCTLVLHMLGHCLNMSLIVWVSLCNMIQYIGVHLKVVKENIVPE